MDKSGCPLPPCGSKSPLTDLLCGKSAAKKKAGRDDLPFLNLAALLLHLRGNDVLCLGTFLALGNSKLDALTFSQGFKA